MKLRVLVSTATTCAVTIVATAWMCNPLPAAAQPQTGPSFDVIQQYAPLIYLYPGEQFLPGTLEEYSQNVHMMCNGKAMPNILEVTTNELVPYNYGGPHDNAACRLYTNDPMHDAYDVKPFFHGHTPTAQNPIPVYVYTYDVSSTDNTTFTAQYNTFYPYNLGKGGCPLLTLSGNCMAPSGRRVFDDHVADWELMTIRFEKGKAVAVHVGAHGNSQDNDEYDASTYFPKADPNTGTVRWESDTDLFELGDFLTTIASKGPWYLEWEGDHPIVYSAKGSHGIWAQPGEHVYRVAAGDLLSDDAGKGSRWETWHLTVNATLPKYATMLFAYDGDWGNPRMGSNVCDFVKDNIDSLPGGMIGRLGYELFSGHDPCDDMSKSLKETYQLNDGPSTPDRERDQRYVNANLPPPPPPCKPVPMEPATNAVVYGMGRDSVLYRKPMNGDGPWSKVPGYASTRKIVSITVEANGTMVGLEKGGKIYQLAAPYSGDWQPASFAENSGLKGIFMPNAGGLIGVVEGGMLQSSPDSGWRALGAGASVDPAWTTAAVMPNGHYLLGVPISKNSQGTFGYGGLFAEYEDDEGELEPVSIGIAKTRPELGPPLYPAKLTGTIPNSKPQSFTYLPNQELLYATEIGKDRLIGWYVDNCGQPTLETFSNAGAPPFGFPGIDPATPQWQSLTVIPPMEVKPPPPANLGATVTK